MVILPYGINTVLLFFQKEAEVGAEFGCRSLLHNLLSLPVIITFILGKNIHWVLTASHTLILDSYKWKFWIIGYVFYYFFDRLLLSCLPKWICQFILTPTMYGSCFPPTFSQTQFYQYSSLSSRHRGLCFTPGLIVHFHHWSAQGSFLF